MTLTVEDVKRETKSYALDIVTRFSYINHGLTDLGQIQSLSNLVYLNLSNNKLTDISQAVRIQSLQVLIVDGNQLTQLPVAA